ncbi:MAG: DUF2085 domain-containing protein [Candidatus Altiarchaeota archaeon]|nr:DUF2085 domain-containing protein [Candidatus Altiarchaeota archaeon]
MDLKSKLRRLWGSEDFWMLAYISVLTYAVSLVFFTVLFLAAPYLITSENSFIRGLGAVAYNSVSLFKMCHQLPERSLFIGGVQFPICARCLGIYIGGSIGAIAAFIAGRPKFLSGKVLLVLFVALTAPMAIDGVTQTLLYARESSNGLRLVTGLLFGFGLLYPIGSVVFAKARRLSSEKRQVEFMSLAVNGFVVLLVLAAGVYAGMHYLSQADAFVHAGRVISFTVAETRLFYIPPNAVANVRYDPYLKSYNDAVLSDIARINYDSHPHGLWAVVFLVEPPAYEGKVVYYSSGGSECVYLDAWTGEVAFRSTH